MTEQYEAPSAELTLLTIERLVQFARQNGLLKDLDLHYARNELLALFGFSEPLEGKVPDEELDSAVPLLEILLDYGYSIGLIPDNILTYRDLLDARIMGLLMPRPSETEAMFRRKAELEGLPKATDQFYKLNIDSNYIRMDRIAKNKRWLQATDYGNLEITINLSKPEKDPKEIALLKTLPPARYPKCLLCAENVGYAGRADHPARQNLRILPLTLQGEQWYFQYSPYVYYNEHSIVFKGAHEPMVISHQSFARLLDFVEQFPHYFIGSNADLPIVGGSILSHDHFQAGRHIFPMETAPIEALFTDPLQPGVKAGIVRWPMSVVRVNGSSKEAVHAMACKILDEWRQYDDHEADIHSFSEHTDGSRIPHNTITPIARLRDNGEYEVDLVLRNNRTSEEHPDGIFHPHQQLHHIKKENIGLIEVMGLAVLPGRLKTELEQIARLLTEEHEDIAGIGADSAHSLHKHAEWIASLLERYGSRHTAEQAALIVEQETGRKFAQVLEDAGVYKRTEAGLQSFSRFLTSIGLHSL
ncbi:UDP-glucose--hexose-1-phosphate uridylyltransferase [Paenibacillus sp. GCM10023252]|uniref:UDP-glucose--hexose-1-phosphate uridylyltransferase n=1 Tax=Paenibacillus sp. GCM10023252 TaxID=3252649 RepID=UPI0036114C98